MISKLAYDMIIALSPTEETVIKIAKSVAKKDGKQYKEVIKSFDFDTNSSLFNASNNAVLNPLFGTDVDALTRRFNPNGLLDVQTASELYSLIREKSQPLRTLFSNKTTNTDIYRVRLLHFSEERLLSVPRTSGDLTGYKKDLMNMLGFDILVQTIEMYSDIPLEVLFSLMYEEDFLSAIDSAMMTAKTNDIGKLLTKGRGMSGSSFMTKLRGYEHLLRYLDGDNTFSAQTISVFGELGYFMSPYRINVKKINDTLANWTGQDTFLLFDSMLELATTYEEDTVDWVFACSQKDYFDYMQYRSATGENFSTPVGINTESREYMVQNGMALRHRGVKIYVDRNLKPVKNGGSVVYGDFKEFFVVESTSGIVSTMRLEPRTANGATWERTDIFRYGTGIRDKRKFVIAFSSYEYNVQGSAVSTDEVKCPSLHLVDKTGTHITNKVALGSVVNGTSTYGYAFMHPERYTIWVSDKNSAETTAAGIVAEDNPKSAGFDFGTLAAGAYKVVIGDKENLLDYSAVVTVTVS